jgi:hypothetical protein
MIAAGFWSAVDQLLDAVGGHGPVSVLRAAARAGSVRPPGRSRSPCSEATPTSARWRRSPARAGARPRASGYWHLLPVQPPPPGPFVIGVVGTTGFEGDDAGPAPTALVAVTVNVYVSPAVSPVTVMAGPPSARVMPVIVAV